jgi:hypothetical protein
MISYVTRFIDLSDKPFILHPHPQEDELLSSWLVRVSLAHDTMPCSFMNMHFPEYKNIVFSRDVDVWAPKEFLEKLAWKSNYSYEQIYNLTLRSYIGTLLPEFNPSGPNKYFSYIKIRARSNKLYGQRYCSKCLQEDQIPYFRKEWRLKAISKCEKHSLELHDSCSQCGIPISFYKFNSNGFGFNRCWKCNFDLCN